MPSPDMPLTVTYDCPRWVPEWAVPEVPVPESNTHDLSIEMLRAVLLAWAQRESRNVMVARNLGIRWHQAERRAGFDPDLCVIEPPPPERHVSSLRLWEPGHVAPWLAVEVVSPGHPYKDYIDTPERCAACGIGELWVFDPLLKGPKRTGGPHALQIWTGSDGTMTRVHASNQPGYSPALQAWVHPVTLGSDDPNERPAPNTTTARLRISNAQVGGTYWPTQQEQERAAVAAERDEVAAERDEVAAERDEVAAERDKERAARQALERELAALRGTESG